METVQNAAEMDSSEPAVTSEATQSAITSMNTNTLSSGPQVMLQEESVLDHPPTDTYPHEGEYSEQPSTRAVAEDDDELPLIHMNSKATGASSKKTKKMGLSTAGPDEVPPITDKAKKSSQLSSAKRLPIQVAKGQAPLDSSLPISGPTARTTTPTTTSLTKAAPLADGAPQLKKKKKMPKPVGDNTYISEGNPNKMTQLNPYMYGQPQPPPPHLSAAQAAVNEMMRQALQEYQYSAMGSIVETDSESQDEAEEIDGSYKSENDFMTRVWCVEGGMPTIPPTLMKMDRSLLLASMKKRLRIEGQSTQQALSYHSASNKNSTWENEEDEEEVVESSFVHEGEEDKYEDGLEEELEDVKMQVVESKVVDANSKVDSTMQGLPLEQETITKEDLHTKKKRKRGNRQTDGDIGTSSSGEAKVHDVNNDLSDPEDQMEKTIQGTSDVTKAGAPLSSQTEDYYEDEETGRKEMEESESSIFGQTQGSANATWVECDKCGKWRRLRGIVDANKLPTKWYCSMNKRDPERAKCTAPEEKYDSAATTPESAADQRARKHLRLWVRRLNCNENYEARMLTTVTRGKKKNNATSSKEPYEWVRCCNPSCGKWRALLKFMDSSNVVEAAKNGEWYCVMNTWDEKLASCAAPQEHLPSNTPPWVLRNDI